jgi:hypothetical protein
MATPRKRKPKHDLPPLLRTPEEIWQAGWDSGEHDRPLSPKERAKLVALIRPYWKRAA